MGRAVLMGGAARDAHEQDAARGASATAGRWLLDKGQCCRLWSTPDPVLADATIEVFGPFCRDASPARFLFCNLGCSSPAPDWMLVQEFSGKCRLWSCDLFSAAGVLFVTAHGPCDCCGLCFVRRRSPG